MNEEILEVKAEEVKAEEVKLNALIPQNVEIEISEMVENLKISSSNYFALETAEINEVSRSSAIKADEAIVLIKKAVKFIEDNRKATVQPYQKDVDSINEFFKIKVNLLGMLSRSIQGALLAFKMNESRFVAEQQRKEHERIAIERAKLESKIEKAEERSEANPLDVKKSDRVVELKTTQEFLTPVVHMATQTKSKVVKTYQAEITDKVSLIKSLLENNLTAFIDIDLKKLNKRITEEEGKVQYSGVRVNVVENIKTHVGRY